MGDEANEHVAQIEYVGEHCQRFVLSVMMWFDLIEREAR